MTWKLVNREFHCAPYKLTPGTIGWSVWYSGNNELKRIGIGIEFLRDAKQLAEKHKQGAA